MNWMKYHLLIRLENNNSEMLLSATTRMIASKCVIAQRAVEENGKLYGLQTAML